MFRALVVGPNRDSQSAAFLRERGCEVQYAASYEEAWAVLEGEHFDFDLVLSPMRIRHRTGLDLVTLLEGSRVSLYFSYVVEQGSWWMPALREGKKCFGTAALRVNEFSAVLEETIQSARIRDQLGRVNLFHPNRKMAG